jgi:hypothetical protein
VYVLSIKTAWGHKKIYKVSIRAGMLKIAIAFKFDDEILLK